MESEIDDKASHDLHATHIGQGPGSVHEKHLFAVTNS